MNHEFYILSKGYSSTKEFDLRNVYLQLFLVVQMYDYCVLKVFFRHYKSFHY